MRKGSSCKRDAAIIEQRVPERPAQRCLRQRREIESRAGRQTPLVDQCLHPVAQVRRQGEFGGPGDDQILVAAGVGVVWFEKVRAEKVRYDRKSRRLTSSN